jgi:hypothetical protein
MLETVRDFALATLAEQAAPQLHESAQSAVAAKLEPEQDTSGRRWAAHGG